MPPSGSSHSDESYVAEITAFRAEKDRFFGASPDSPFPARERGAAFGGLRYYPPDPALRVVAEVVPFADPRTVPLGSTKGDVRPQVRYAELRFTLAGEACHLLAFTDPDAGEHAELFVPFRDATSGSETYGAGRYLETSEKTRPDGSRSAELDFNLAYSPWCAYNPAYSCTLPPPENRLPVAVRAGERSYHDE
ncbi:MAG TPA: DUF1684 domain-containing protein [Ktedonobacterales bacterium]|jgi:hypothetical protein